MIAKSLPYLLLVLACSDRSQRAASVAAPAALSQAERSELEPVGQQSVMMVNVGWTNSADTLTWSDTTRRGDTSFAARGRVITTTTLLVDSQWVQLPQRSVISGIPVGLFGIWEGTRLKPNTEVLSLSTGAESPGTIVRRLELARTRGVRMVTSMAGGARANYLTDGVFDMAKWQARIDAYNKPAIREAVAQAVSEGVLIGNSVLDEPYNTGEFAGQAQNGWGPAGTLYKARVDSMCGYVKAIFPMLPQGVFHDYTLEGSASYQVCDFVTTQYRTIKGPLAKYRDGALALCRRDRHACAFALNVLDGGTQAPRRNPDGTRKTGYDPADCPLTTTGGRGTYFPNCRMTPEQVREAGQILGAAGCFLTGWRYDSTFMARPENQQAFRDIGAALAARSAPKCIRS